jgi:hypothetical protein
MTKKNSTLAASVAAAYMCSAALLGGTLMLSSPAMAQDKPDKSEAVERFKKADTNDDGFISKAEWTAAGLKERGFGRVDANGDKKVTPTELQTAITKMRGR